LPTTSPLIDADSFVFLVLILLNETTKGTLMADIVETAVNAGTFNTLVKAAEAAEVVELLKSPGPYTVFAPTDEAFASLPEGTLDSLLQDIPKLKRIVLYHVAFGDVRAEDLMQIEEAETVEGSILAVESSNGIKVNDANVLKTDILTDNGVIHVIDAVLIPALVAAE
jgi:uncharacterized surface protein with fasciclin (FAS1) repeats